MVLVAKDVAQYGILLFTGILNIPLSFCIDKITDLYMWMFNISWALPIGLLASLIY